MGNQEPKKTSIMQGVDHHELHQKVKKVVVSRLSDYLKFRPGESVADVAKHILENGMPDTLDIDSHFEVLFKKDTVTQSEREYLFMKFHKLRLDTSLRSAVLDSLNLPHSLRTQVPFYQSFLDELLQAKLQLYMLSVKSITVKNSAEYKLNDIEKEILYYVSGYVIRKVSDLPDINKDLVSSLHT